MKKNAIVLLSMITVAAYASDYPKKPITMVVGYAAGGPSDTVTRIISDALSKVWGVPVIVDNKPGATATIATSHVAKAKADGYTLLVIANDFVTSRFVYPKLPYDPIKDITPIGLLSATPNVLVTSTTTGYKNYSDFYKNYEVNHANWSYSSTGLGSTSHIAVEVYSKITGKSSNHVPYKGFAPSLPDLITGRINFAMPSLSSVNSQFKAEKLVPLAIGGQKRSLFLPNVPTFEEVGVKGFDIKTWYGLAAPSGIPDEILRKISADLSAVLIDPAVVKKIHEQGSEVNIATPSDFQNIISDEVKFMSNLVKNIDIN